MEPDNPRVSCCGESDAFEADSYEVEGDHYVAIITDGKGTIPNGTKIPVPNHKMKWDDGNPTGHGIIFIGTHGQIFCYVGQGECSHERVPDSQPSDGLFLLGPTIPALERCRAPCCLAQPDRPTLLFV